MSAKDRDHIAQLEQQLSDANLKIKELETIAAKVTELEAKMAQAASVAAVTTDPKPSKSKEQAVACLALLQAGTVTVEMLKQINSKYPNDPIYFVRSILKQDVVTHRVKGGATTYSLPTKAAAAAPAAPADDKAQVPTHEAAPAAA